MVQIARTEENNILSPLFAGLVYAMIVAVSATIIISLLLSMTGLREQSLSLYVYMIHGIAVCAGGFICAKRAGVKGWYRGGILGIVYGLLVTLIGYLGFSSSVNLDTLVFLIICVVVGAFGGILGINARK